MFGGKIKNQSLEVTLLSDNSLEITIDEDFMNLPSNRKSMLYQGLPTTNLTINITDVLQFESNSSKPFCFNLTLPRNATAVIFSTCGVLSL